MKTATILASSTLLLGSFLGAQQARAQTAGSFNIVLQNATASSVPFRVGTGKEASYIDSGPITIKGGARGTFDRTGTTARVTWDVTAEAPGLQAQGIGPLNLQWVGVAVLDRERNELVVVDVSSIGGSPAASQSPTCTQCGQNINYLSSPKSGQQQVDWGQGIGGAVEFRSPTAGDLDRHPVADLLLQASRAAGLGLSSRDVEILVGQYRREPTKEITVYTPETGEVFSSDLQGSATVVFESR